MIISLFQCIVINDSYIIGYCNLLQALFNFTYFKGISKYVYLQNISNRMITYKNKLEKKE